ncbi:MAG: hypothetical protein QOF94_142, partial [Acidobacteriaceae bacterium]
LASSGIWRNPVLVVTLQTKVIAGITLELRKRMIVGHLSARGCR